MHRLGSVSECNSKLNLHLCRQALLTLSSDTFFSTARKRVFFIIIIIIVSSIQPEFAIVHPSLYYCLSPSALSLLSHSLSISPSPTNTEQALLFPLSVKHWTHSFQKMLVFSYACWFYGCSSSPCHNSRLTPIMSFDSWQFGASKTVPWWIITPRFGSTAVPRLLWPSLCIPR